MLALNRSFLIGYRLIQISEELGFDHFRMKSPCNIIEDYIEVFDMIHERDVRPFSVRRSSGGLSQ
jgi:hypothetical protein